MVEYLSQQQLQRLRHVAKAGRDALLIDVQYQTGCTVSELTEIKREHIHPDHIKIADRICHIHPELYPRIVRYLSTHDSPYLFPSRQRSHLTDKRIQQIIKPYLKAINPALKKATPHVLRYTHIAHALAQHIPLRAIMEQTGLQELRLAQIASEIGPTRDGGYGEVLQ